MINKYKLPVLAVSLVWVFILCFHYFAADPIKQSIELKEAQNKQLKTIVKRDSLKLLKLESKAAGFDSVENKAKAQTQTIIKRYEQQKSDFINSDLNERRRIFSKLAKED